jgi:hypothetical protein
MSHKFTLLVPLALALLLASALAGDAHPEVMAAVQTPETGEHRSKEQIMSDHFDDSHKYILREDLQALTLEVHAKITPAGANMLEWKLKDAHSKNEMLTQDEYNKLYGVWMCQLFVEYIYVANRRLLKDDAKHFLENQMWLMFVYSEREHILKDIQKKKNRELTPEEEKIINGITTEFERTGVIPGLQQGMMGGQQDAGDDL